MEKGGYSLGGVASRSAARSGGIGIDRRMVLSRRRRLLRAGEAWGRSEPVVASIGLTEGKGEAICGLSARSAALY